MYIQGLLLNEKESLIPNENLCGETNCTGYDPNILVSIPKIMVFLMLIDNHFASNGCFTKYCYWTYINTHYLSLLIKFI